MTTTPDYAGASPRDWVRNIANGLDLLIVASGDRLANNHLGLALEYVRDGDMHAARMALAAVLSRVEDVVTAEQQAEAEQAVRDAAENDAMGVV